jgi:hypothetical protein
MNMKANPISSHRGMLRLYTRLLEMETTTPLMLRRIGSIRDVLNKLETALLNQQYDEAQGQSSADGQ